MQKDIFKKKKLPLLNTVMKMKGASNEALAAASGVSTRTINTARRGGEITGVLAEFISIALYEREFTYQKRGPKSGRRAA